VRDRNHAIFNRRHSSVGGSVLAGWVRSEREVMYSPTPMQ